MKQKYIEIIVAALLLYVSCVCFYTSSVGGIHSKIAGLIWIWLAIGIYFRPNGYSIGVGIWLLINVVGRYLMISRNPEALEITGTTMTGYFLSEIPSYLALIGCVVLFVRGRKSKAKIGTKPKRQ